MALHRNKRGLDLPLSGEPETVIEDAARPSTVAFVTSDLVGLKPAMKVATGDAVAIGQVLFEHKKLAGVRFTSPAAGTVTAVERGAKRALQSVVIRLTSDTQEEQVALRSFTDRHPSSLDAADVRDLLLESGLWTALRARPFGGIADPAIEPRAIFVTAFDSEPHAPDLDVVAAGREDDLERGLTALLKLTAGNVYLCRRAGSGLEGPADPRLAVEDFSGPHPSGTAGLHIHSLDPAGRGRVVWYAGLQDVLAIGHLFSTGEIDTRRVIALSGPAVERPRLLRTRSGVALDALVAGEINAAGARTISGSVLSGRTAMGPVHGYLGRYDQQVSVLSEATQRPFLGWLAPGTKRFSLSAAFLSSFLPRKKRDFTTTTYGDPRAIVPIGLYERVTAMDIEPSFLLKSLVVGDIERAEELGALELEEQDLALLTFVCPSKIDYGPHLREVLDTIEKEG